MWRAALHISYEVWQAIHLVLSTVAITAALVHVELIGHYVNQPWKRVLWAVMTAGFLAVFVWVRVVRPIMRTRRSWTVTSVVPERGGVSTITLRPVGHGGFTFAPGQFGWLSVHRSPFALTQHPFSFSSNGDDSSRLQMSSKGLGDFTRTISSIEPGTRAYIDGPHGVFSPDRYSGPGFVFLGGGVGMGPLMSMLRTFAARGERRTCHLFFGIPRFEEATFREEIDTLTTQLPLTVVYVCVQPADRLDQESEATSLPTRYAVTCHRIPDAAVLHLWPRARCKTRWKSPSAPSKSPANVFTPSVSTSSSSRAATVRHQYTQRTAIAVAALILLCCLIFALVQH